jgi:hypothetical protein
MSSPSDFDLKALADEIHARIESQPPLKEKKRGRESF